MTPPIERVRYYDGEYLRAFDFAAEQAYHVDMRRRLNIGLHLYGIVEGLQLQDSSDASTGISQVSVASGMAIDAFGREIFLLAPYTFDDVADVNANRITVAGQYEVWIQYVRVQDTPPSVGYAACDVTAQNTRWLETYKIVLLKSTTSTILNPPQVTDDISEDETPDPDTSNGVFLGLLYATPGSTTGVFSLNYPTGATVSPIVQPALAYIGLSAQKIEPPNFPDPTSFAVLVANNPQMPPLGVEVRSNLFCDQNLIVGPDFAVSAPSSGPPAPPTPFPTSPTGNLKVASDLFIQGNLYSNVSGNSLSLAQQVAALLPDVLVGFWQVPSVATDTLSSDTFTFTPPKSRLKVIGSANASAAIASIKWNTRNILTLNLAGADHLLVEISHVTAIPNTTNPSLCDVSVTWAVGPNFPNAKPVTSPAHFEKPIVDLWISYVVVCYPP